MTISVYITSFNQKEFLREAIEGVLAQTLMPDEIIIVDDCSSDGSDELIRYYADQHKIIKYFIFERNQGVSKVRSKAISMVTSDFFTYCDGDDLYLPNKLETEVEIIKNYNCDVAFSNNSYYTEELDKFLFTWAEQTDDLITSSFKRTLCRNYPRNSLFRMELIRKNAVEEIGGYDHKLELYEDYDFRIRLSKEFKIVGSNVVTTHIRQSKSGLSKRPIQQHISAYNYIFKKYRQDIKQLGRNERKEIFSRLNELKTAQLKKSRKRALLSRIRKYLGRK
ncbi:glycosyltransferase family 2 protein [Nonlabens xiamenensis]|uniref:glycosyltransferase family 2 protein n=1 Tax=Nonlabens xiamenensis TaxID=2341043 RepID=UPI000F6157A6|nr:glycosyltransferase family 2 protein [Nonlabens xiamenensis]